MRDLFALALTATRFLFNAEEERTIINFHVQCTSVLSSEKDAREEGLKTILLACPLEEGWIDHKVFLTMIPFEDITLAYQEHLH